MSGTPSPSPSVNKDKESVEDDDGPDQNFVDLIASLKLVDLQLFLHAVSFPSQVSTKICHVH